MGTVSLGITVEITGAHLHILQMGKLGEGKGTVPLWWTHSHRQKQICHLSLWPSRLSSLPGPGALGD